jgi:hypothetical protein
MRSGLMASSAVVALSFAGAAALAHPHTVRFTPAPHRKPPDIQDHGYRPEPLRVIAFVPSGYPDASELAAWPKAIVKSQWLARLERAYGIPTSPSPVGHGYVVSNMPKLPNRNVSTTSVFNSWVKQELAGHDLQLHVAGYQTIIVLFQHCSSPQSLDGFGCTSHHPSIGTGLDAYALSLGNPTGSAADQRDSLSETASHEIAEGATNTGPDGWRLTATDKDRPWSHSSVANAHDPQGGLLASANASPFLEDEASGNVEAADLMSGSRWFENATPPGFSRPIRYGYVRVFSDYGNDHRSDPGVPPSPDPYFNTTTVSDWYHLHVGGSKEVTVTGWSTKPLPKWSVKATIPAWEHSSARGGSQTKPDPCELSNSTFMVANDDSFTLKVTATHTATAGLWCVAHLQSALLPEPRSNGDTSHQWYVGFILTSGGT